MKRFIILLVAKNMHPAVDEQNLPYSDYEIMIVTIFCISCIYQSNVQAAQQTMMSQSVFFLEQASIQ